MRYNLADSVSLRNSSRPPKTVCGAARVRGASCPCVAPGYAQAQMGGGDNAPRMLAMSRLTRWTVYLQGEGQEKAKYMNIIM